MNPDPDEPERVQHGWRSGDEWHDLNTGRFRDVEDVLLPGDSLDDISRTQRDLMARTIWEAQETQQHRRRRRLHRDRDEETD